MEIMKKNLTNDWVSIMRTEKVIFTQNLEPWKEIVLPVDCLLSSKQPKYEVHDIPVRFVIKKYDSSGVHMIVCCRSTTVGTLINGDSLFNFDENPANGNYAMKIHRCQLIRTSSFLDYIQNGCEVNMVVGVDFTGSNLDRSTGINLHNPDLSQNQYYNAISNIGSILLFFDSDKEVPLFGFGAMVDESHYSDVSHCFAMNGNCFRPEVYYIDGIKDCYENTIPKVIFAGPTYFAPMLKAWNDMVTLETQRNPKKYYVFLLLTDGINHDIDDTVEQVVISSRLPISIIIVGVGQANFSNMVFLDSDEQPLFCKKTQTFSKRDNVQFVEYNAFKDHPELLAKETLMELPRQMIDHFVSVDLSPDDMGMTHEDMEVKDYFLTQAMEFMTNSTADPDVIQHLLNEGVADKNINLATCNLGYKNKLKL